MENKPPEHSISLKIPNLDHDSALAVAEAIENFAHHIKEAQPRRSRATDRRETLLMHARRIYNARRATNRIMDLAGFLTSPAFDTLLDLYINAASQRSVSVTSACIGTSCPPTTALRWIRLLEKQGLVSRSSDPLDRRKTYLVLTNEGIQKVEFLIAEYLVDP